MFYFGHFMSGSNACLKRGSNQIYVFIFVENVGDKSRLHSWRDVCEGDIKIFLANLIAMGLVRKGSMPKYWDHGETLKTSLEPTWDVTLSRVLCQIASCRFNFRSPMQSPSS